ncbi:hypothetical protein HPB51_024870 [Rhipicephalus microplus]|uniref:Tick transposon n=1 Tax=Rhipicephalus microplus TaxID=6941 RepID=A0A9J6F8D3_RHIMP|nr:hypothetical protein HPB51_024870 [Rhipicephalus microplus]
MYRDILRLRLNTTGSENAWAHFSRIINRTTEFLWNHVLPGLRQSLRKKTPVPKSQVKVIGNTTLPDNIREVLELGPKFAVEPKKSAPELLGMVRQVSKQVPDAESDRCVSEAEPLFHFVRAKDETVRFEQGQQRSKDYGLLMKQNRERTQNHAHIKDANTSAVLTGQPGQQTRSLFIPHDHRTNLRTNTIIVCLFAFFGPFACLGFLRKIAPKRYRFRPFCRSHGTHWSRAPTSDSSADCALRGSSPLTKELGLPASVPGKNVRVSGEPASGKALLFGTTQPLQHQPAFGECLGRLPNLGGALFEGAADVVRAQGDLHGSRLPDRSYDRNVCCRMMLSSLGV